MAHTQDGTRSDLEQLTATVESRQLTTTVLLLLASHRPLTFVAGQLLYALAPSCALLGWDQASAWADLLSAPDANQRLSQMFAPSTASGA